MIDPIFYAKFVEEVMYSSHTVGWMVQDMRYMCMCTYEYTFICIHMYIHMRMSTYVCIQMYVYICMYTYVIMCKYVCIHVHIYAVYAKRGKIEEEEES